MFEEKEIKNIYDKNINTFSDESFKKYINNKILKHGILNITLDDLNKLSKNNEYDIKNLKLYLSNIKVSYSKLIGYLGIPKATLSLTLNNKRTITLNKLNYIFKELQKNNITINKSTLMKEEK